MSMIDVHLAEKPRSPARFNRTRAMTALAAILTLGFAVGPVTPTVAQEKPNIIFIMGDDIGWSNIGVYNQGIMAGRTPNLDRLASRGCGSPITTPRRAARPDEPISSLASCRSARV